MKIGQYLIIVVEAECIVLVFIISWLQIIEHSTRHPNTQNKTVFNTN